MAWKLRHQSKTDYLSSNRTQKGQKDMRDLYFSLAIYLASNGNLKLPLLAQLTNFFAL